MEKLDFGDLQAAVTILKTLDYCGINITSYNDLMAYESRKTEFSDGSDKGQKSFDTIIEMDFKNRIGYYETHCEIKLSHNKALVTVTDSCESTERTITHVASVTLVKSFSTLGKNIGIIVIDNIPEKVITFSGFGIDNMNEINFYNFEDLLDIERLNIQNTEAQSR